MREIYCDHCGVAIIEKYDNEYKKNMEYEIVEKEDRKVDIYCEECFKSSEVKINIFLKKLYNLSISDKYKIILKECKYVGKIEDAKIDFGIGMEGTYYTEKYIYNGVSFYALIRQNNYKKVVIDVNIATSIENLYMEDW